MLLKHLIVLIGFGAFCLQISFTKLTTEKLCSICGQLPEIWTRILGGQSAIKWPWMGAIINKNLTTNIVCGAAIINELYALTASHCFFFPNTNNRFIASDLQLRLGEYDTRLVDGRAVNYQVEKTFIHPGYDDKNVTNDIGIVKLTKPVTFTDVIKPICLPDTYDLIKSDYKYEKPYIAGWGITKIGGTSSPVLQQIQLYVADHKVCKKQYKNTVLQISDKQFCTGHPKDGKNICMGDSGGPVMIQNSLKQFAIIGVVSVGYQCGMALYPSVNTRVASYLSWIKNITDMH